MDNITHYAYCNAGKQRQTYVQLQRTASAIHQNGYASTRHRGCAIYKPVHYKVSTNIMPQYNHIQCGWPAEDC